MSDNKHVSIRQVELIKLNYGLRRVLKQTREIEIEVLEYLCDVAMKHWDILAPLNQQERLTCMEQLVHKTKKNPNPLYPDFDTKFKKFPSYLRRSAINAATGAVSSYKTRLADYDSRKYEAMSNGRKLKEKAPKFSASSACLTLYKSNAYDRDGKKVKIKVFIRNTWDWIEVPIATRDWKDLEDAVSRAKKVCNPSLVYKYHKYYLVFPVEFGCSGFPDVELKEQKVLAVDLGINHGAVCSVVGYHGDVSARMFDPFTRERKALDSCINAIRYVQRKSGVGQSIPAVYQKLDGLKDNYVKQLAHWIVAQAVQHGVYGIVLEHLGKMKGRGRKKDRIHHWCKARLYDYIKGMAFRYGIRVFRINPKNTSKLAYDGSGDVKRDNDNFSLCTFASGKRYACDLSASYNIGARYFLRAMQNAMSSEAWERLKAEVPELATRTRWTLSSLWKASAIPEENYLGTPEVQTNAA